MSSLSTCRIWNISLDSDIKVPLLNSRSQAHHSDTATISHRASPPSSIHEISMPPAIETPMNTAHQHTANADDYLSKGLIVLAAEEHYKAAEAYLSAIDRSHDESAKRTLRRLYDEHCKAGKELQRKIEKLKSEGKDPALPQKADSPKAPPLRQQSSSYLAGSPRVHSSSPPPHRPMTDSQNTVDESFMLLGGQRSDPGDAFNQFWNIMQGMLDNLSQPVAFATAPLGNVNRSTSPTSGTKTPPAREGLRKDNSFSSDTDYEEPMLSRFTRRIGIGSVRDSNKTSQPSSSKQNSISPDGEDFEDDDLFDEEGDHLSESFCLIPSGDEPSPAVLKKENTSLKAETAALQKRLKATERMLQMRKEQDVQLRDSIFQATREAQRAMGTSALLQRPGLDFSALNNIPAVPVPGMNTGREAQYARRVKELEDELRAVRAENEKHKLMITKFRERWEKLKESAKRKKEAKVAAEVAMAGVRDRIVEEPEAEEELDGATES